jgi:formylglycine-generating enzyme required for sulfatase activity
VDFVSWGDATRYCNWLTNGQRTGAQDQTTTEDGSYYLNGATSDLALAAVTRKANAKYVIPTDNEWYKAAYYDPNKPGGPGYWLYPTKSNSIPTNAPDANGTNNANYWDDHGTGIGGPSIGAPYGKTEAGAFASSPSSYGAFDMGGNAMEWTESNQFDYTRHVTGGAFAWDDTFLAAASWMVDDPTYEADGFGFRIAEVPEPLSAVVLLMGAMLVTRRRVCR